MFYLSKNECQCIQKIDSIQIKCNHYKHYYISALQNGLLT